MKNSKNDNNTVTTKAVANTISSESKKKSQSQHQAVFQEYTEFADDELIQGMFKKSSNKSTDTKPNFYSQFVLQKKENNTGLPDNLKSGIEKFSGVDISDVKVHKNSSMPESVQAHAFTQGNDIHIASGQEQHLAHEAWHVVQQKQGRVNPTTEINGLSVNDDISLEKEADIMGTKITQSNFQNEKFHETTNSDNISSEAGILQNKNISSSFLSVVQRYKAKPAQRKKINEKMNIKWGKELKKEIRGSDTDYEEYLGDIVNDLIEFCTSHNQALLILEKASYGEWSSNTKISDEFEKDLLGSSSSEEVVEQTNPLDIVKQKIKSKGLKLSEFTNDDLLNIDAIKSQGWEKAIQQIWTAVNERNTNKRLREEAIDKYAADKLIGDAHFTGELEKAIWGISYTVATSPASKINTTVSTSYSDTDIMTAVGRWHGYSALSKVSDFHVPGHPYHCIEDKSTREKNPDPSRGRQADFCSIWGGSKINVHVNSTQEH